MATEIRHPVSHDRPLVGDVEGMGDASAGSRRGREDRDEAIIRLLRDKLKDRDAGIPNATPSPRPARKAETDGEDKYEPQRLSRKICWQYDSNAQRVPLLRRHYI